MRSGDRRKGSAAQAAKARRPSVGSSSSSPPWGPGQAKGPRKQPPLQSWLSIDTGWLKSKVIVGNIDGDRVQLSSEAILEHYHLVYGQGVTVILRPIERARSLTPHTVFIEPVETGDPIVCGSSRRNLGVITQFALWSLASLRSRGCELPFDATQVQDGGERVNSAPPDAILLSPETNDDDVPPARSVIYFERGGPVERSCYCYVTGGYGTTFGQIRNRVDSLVDALHVESRSSPDNQADRAMIDASGFDIRASVERSDATLDFLLPQVPVIDPSPLRVDFYEGPRAHSIDRVKELAARGWSAEMVRSSDWRSSAAWPYLVLAGHELRKRNQGQPSRVGVFADALTAAATALVSRRVLLNPDHIVRLAQLVNEWVGFRPAYPVAYPAASSKRAALHDLLQRAPWIVFLMKRKAVITIRLGQQAAVEAALIAGAGFVPNVDKTALLAESDGPGMGALAVAGFLDDEAALTADGLDLLLAAGAASRFDEYFTRLRDRLNPQTNRLLDAVIGPFLAIQQGSASDLSMVVDWRGYSAIVKNSSVDRTVTVAGSSGEQSSLYPFQLAPTGKVTGSCRVYFSSNETPAVQVNGRDVHLVRPQEAFLRLDAGATTENIAAWMFQGRKKEIAVIDRAIDAPPGIRKPLAIVGSRRSGKTTLAKHALREAQGDGRLGLVLEVNLAATGFYGDDETKFAPYLTKDLREALHDGTSEAGLDIQVDCSTRDPVDFLKELDRTWGSTRKPIGVLFDEFDAIFYRSPGTALYALVQQLSTLHLKNIVLVGTVQRHGIENAGLKEWGVINVDANLTVEDAYSYFLECGTTGEQFSPVTRPGVEPETLYRAVVGRLGLRPYFWARLYEALEIEVKADSSAALIFDTGYANDVIDNVLISDQFWSSLLQDYDPMTHISELKRLDTFTLPERALLAEFSVLDSGVSWVEEARIRKVFGNDLSAVTEMLNRGMMKVQGPRYSLDPPLLGEWAKVKRLELDPYRLRPAAYRVAADGLAPDVAR